MAKQKPNYKQNVSKLFVTVPEEQPEEIQAEPIQEQPAQEATTEAPQLPPMPETKSKRLQLLIRPTTDKALAKEAKKRRISKNELINRILEEHTKGVQ